MRIGMDSLLCCLELLEITWDQNLKTLNSLSTALGYPECDSQPWESVLPQYRIGRIPDGNRDRFVAVLSRILGNQLEPNEKHLEIPVQYLHST